MCNISEIGHKASLVLRFLFPCFLPHNGIFTLISFPHLLPFFPPCSGPGLPRGRTCSQLPFQMDVATWKSYTLAGRRQADMFDGSARKYSWETNIVLSSFLCSHFAALKHGYRPPWTVKMRVLPSVYSSHCSF